MTNDTPKHATTAQEGAEPGPQKLVIAPIPAVYSKHQTSSE